MNRLRSLCVIPVKSTFVCLVLLLKSQQFASAQPVPAALATFFDFNAGIGVNPSSLVEAADGGFYGVCSDGGNGFFSYGNGYFEPYGDGGTAFKVTPDGTPVWSFAFNGTNGANPETLVQGSDGNFYGTTWLGGAYGGGTVFEISSNGLLSSLFSFNGTNGYEAETLLKGEDGALYGTTYGGGPDSDSGTIFRMTTDGNLTTLHSFQGVNDGAQPLALFQDIDGNLYGTAYSGGASNSGTIFAVTTNGEFNTLYTFSGGADGANPAGLIRGNDGSLYGVTEAGGFDAGYGAVGTAFRLQTNGLLTTIAFFSGPNGAAPYSIMQGNDGNFYGTTLYGGTFTNQFCFAPPYAGIESSYGTIFRLTTAGLLTTLISFDLSNGVSPISLTQEPNGCFYGMTQYGGTNGQYYTVVSSPGNFTSGGDGTIFRFAVPAEPPIFESVIRQGGAVGFAWTAAIGKTYAVQFISDLIQTNWIALGAAFVATNTTMKATDSIGTNAARFYRIVQTP